MKSSSQLILMLFATVLVPSLSIADDIDNTPSNRKLQCTGTTDDGQPFNLAVAVEYYRDGATDLLKLKIGNDSFPFEYANHRLVYSPGKYASYSHPFFQGRDIIVSPNADGTSDITLKVRHTTSGGTPLESLRIYHATSASCKIPYVQYAKQKIFLPATNAVKTLESLITTTRFATNLNDVLDVIDNLVDGGPVPDQANLYQFIISKMDSLTGAWFIGNGLYDPLNPALRLRLSVANSHLSPIDKGTLFKLLITPDRLGIYAEPMALRSIRMGDVDKAASQEIFRTIFTDLKIEAAAKKPVIAYSDDLKTEFVNLLFNANSEMLSDRSAAVDFAFSSDLITFDKSGLTNYINASLDPSELASGAASDDLTLFKRVVDSSFFDSNSKDAMTWGFSSPFNEEGERVRSKQFEIAALEYVIASGKMDSATSVRMQKRVKQLKAATLLETIWTALTPDDDKASDTLNLIQGRTDTYLYIPFISHWIRGLKTPLVSVNNLVAELVAQLATVPSDEVQFFLQSDETESGQSEDSGYLPRLLQIAFEPSGGFSGNRMDIINIVLNELRSTSTTLENVLNELGDNAIISKFSDADQKAILDKVESNSLFYIKDSHNRIPLSTFLYRAELSSQPTVSTKYSPSAMKPVLQKIVANPNVSAEQKQRAQAVLDKIP